MRTSSHSEILRRPAATDPLSGLEAAEAAARLQTYGPNEVVRERPASPWKLLVLQFKSPLIALLLAACAVSAAVGETADAIAILAIVVLNAIVGFVQEYRAERSVQALRAITAPRARVVRDGRVVELPAAQVVPGDVLVLEAGDVIAADALVLEAHALMTNEAALTGESLPAPKSTERVDPAAPLAERHDAVFMGTAVVNGTGRALVASTGMHTQLGQIAHLLASAADEATPLELRLARVSRVLISACLAIVLLVALLGLVHGRNWLEVLLSSVSLAVAAVPEGLPAVVTIALAIGVQRMAARHVLVRRLQAVETLGCTTVICTDKTGTLTSGSMRVREIWGDPQRVLDAAAACCDAELDADGRPGPGDPTEIALLLAAAERGISRADIERARPRRHVNPFDAERKRMSIRRSDGVLYLKGALETTLPLCTRAHPEAEAVNAELAARGLRVLAVAIGASEEERELELLGLVGMADPPRPEVIAAVSAARAAGIRTVMITGDNAHTATAIARELGILQPGEEPRDSLHARATPQDKLRIVREWKRRDAIVAMTGDGVNDAPALREAHIGIAMGKTGTEVTREASDMVLADDNYASIIAAVHEGRGIFDNIQKTLVYLLAGNASELALMLGAAALGLPVPLLPLQLLWINLVTDSLPALALVTDPIDPNAMRRPPRRPDEPMLGAQEWRLIVGTAVVEAGVTLGTFVWALDAYGLLEARSMAFSVLVFAELFRAFAARSRTQIFWRVGALTNLRLLVLVVLQVVVQISIHYFPATQKLFHVGALEPDHAALALLLGLVPVSALEVAKLAAGARGRAQTD